MKRESFIKKWLGNKNFQYCEEHKELMREDLDSVLDQQTSKKQTCGFCVEFKGNKEQIDKQEMTIAQLLKHDFKSKGLLSLYDSNGNRIYFEDSSGYWSKREFDANNNIIYYEYSNGRWYKYDYDSNGNQIYLEDSNGYWVKQEYDSNNNCIYFENSNGKIIDKRPKVSCNGKVVEIEGKKYKLTEI